MSGSDRTEKPTPQRRKKAREQGQVARSRDLSSTLATVTGIGVFLYQTPAEVPRWGRLFQRLVDLSIAQNLEAAGPFLYWTTAEIVRWMLPALLAAFGAAALISVAQGGFVFAPAALAIKPERLSPARKLGEMFSIAGMSGLLKSLLPFTAIVYVVISCGREHMAAILGGTMLPVYAYMKIVLGCCFEISWKSALILVVWAVIDYLLNWFRTENSLKMSKQELKQEMKDNDGNPQVKGRMRRMRRSVRRKKMLQDVEKATVVIANPTHFAVALQFDIEMNAPVVLAKGRDLLAQEIKEAAYWQGIPVVENPPLAQALYRSVEIGAAIPSKLYTAVAEVLALIYQQQAARARAATHKGVN
jgi:flagellar biosynthesis protein FlhB